ncbi:hypothetical protein ACTMTJ_25270 [Phytohabitans sp. LJ34]|uniref:hypothetical protein n=1 Tax=Phytohabitans sp. LJ34 TaxID=3452217 RepID=UPI003F8A148E
MDKTPKVVFAAIVVLGLPLAVWVGWHLATDGPPPASRPEGAGNLGTAPPGASAPARGWPGRGPASLPVGASQSVSASPSAPGTPVPSATSTAEPVPTPSPTTAPEATAEPTPPPSTPPVSADPSPSA